MIAIKPYLIRAAYQWALDSGQTPHALVDTSVPGVKVPRDYVEDGRIVLNIDPRATSNLVIGDDLLEFSARFSGQSFEVSAPIGAVLGVYARENGEGISFPAETVAEKKGQSRQEEASPAPGRGKPDLKIIK